LALVYRHAVIAVILKVTLEDYDRITVGGRIEQIKEQVVEKFHRRVGYMPRSIGFQKSKYCTNRYNAITTTSL
jgi:hypothetical protein